MYRYPCDQKKKKEEKKGRKRVYFLCDDMQAAWVLPIFQRNLLPPFYTLKIEAVDSSVMIYRLQ
jgi:hypothetical protein